MAGTRKLVSEKEIRYLRVSLTIETKKTEYIKTNR